MNLLCCWGLIGGHRFLRSLHYPWQTDREGRSATRLALHRNIAAHHLAEPLADREPEAGAAVFPRRRRICLGEFLEQLAHLLGGHADAGVGDRDDNPVATVLLPFPR